VSADGKKLLKVLNGERIDPVPVWMMRQAGRHLPEYLALRAQAKDFLDFCYSPALAAEATLQPVRRYGMDGAILFADILLILDAMGRNVRFVEQEGPRVDPATKASELSQVPHDKVMAKLSPVGETVERVKSQLGPETTLIGFAGSPWTVAIYAIEGKAGGDKSASRLFGYQHPAELDGMLAQLVETTAHYLAMQAKAGADALMLFESWAEGLPSDAFDRWVVQPTAALVKRVRELGVTLPILGFPRGAGGLMIDYATKTGVTAIGLDTAQPLYRATKLLPKGMPVQGNLDPLRLLSGGSELDARVREIVEQLKDRPHIFNLGHGVLPETPIANVERVLAVLRGHA
jgi:uroporphyrinogen decarboxylase